MVCGGAGLGQTAQQPRYGCGMPLPATRGADALAVQFVGESTNACEARAPEAFNDPLEVQCAPCGLLFDTRDRFGVAGLLAAKSTGTIGEGVRKDV
jgi:hypothetical protein